MTFSNFRYGALKEKKKRLQDQMSKSQSHFFENIKHVETEEVEKHEKLKEKRFDKFERLVKFLR